MKNFLRYFSLFLFILVLALTLEFLAGLVPQQAVRKNLLASMEQLQSEGLTPGVLYNGHPRSKLDNLSENDILTYSYYMDTRKDPASILTNPGHQIQAPYEELFFQTEEMLRQELPSDQNYARYFQGFRMIVRPLLAIMNYMDIRQCIQWGFLLLFAAVVVMLCGKTRSIWIPMAFAGAVCQLNPVAISACFQYSQVFYIAFIGMLLVPRILASRIPLGMLFFSIGMVTQIFDFYTAPLLTFGLPALTFLLVSDYEGLPTVPHPSRLRQIFILLGLWLLGYVGVWLGKLFLTTVFTPIDALGDGLSRFAFWMDPRNGGEPIPYLPFQAVYWCFINLLDVVPLAVEIGILILFFITVSIRHRWKSGFLENWLYLLLAALPFVWFMVAAKPSYNHFYFQYRSLGIFLFGGLVFLIRCAGWDSIKISKTKNA